MPEVPLFLQLEAFSWAGHQHPVIMMPLGRASPN